MNITHAILGQADKSWLFDRLPQVLPAKYRMTERLLDGCTYIRSDGLSVIVSGAVELDGRRWIHLSCAHRKHLPTWSDLVEIKELFIGREEKAIQVIPPRSQHVNYHPNCLHLFSCVDDDPLPDFTRGQGRL